MTMLNTTGTPISVGLGGIFGFIRAVAGDLPDPSAVNVYSHSRTPTAHLLFASLDDLRNWAAYLQVGVTARPVLNSGHDTTHHNAEAMWGPVDGKMVNFYMTFIEDHAIEPEQESTIPRDCEAAEW